MVKACMRPLPFSAYITIASALEVLSLLRSSRSAQTT